MLFIMGEQMRSPVVPCPPFLPTLVLITQLQPDPTRF